MPLSEFACAPGKPTFGETHTIDHCIGKCKHQCYSPYLMAAIAASNQKNYHKGKYVSMTSLYSCTRKLKAERTEDYADYFQNLYYAFRGTITHTVIEEAVTVKLADGRSLEDLGFLSEWRMIIGFCFTHGGFRLPSTVRVEDEETWKNVECPHCHEAGIDVPLQDWFILGGTLDGAEPLWDLLEDGVLPMKLHDVKTMQEYAVAYFIKGDAGNTLHPQVKDGFVFQARGYAYTAEIAEPPEALRNRGVKKIKMVSSDIQAFAMGQAPWTGGGTYRWKDHYQHPLKDWPMYSVEIGDREWIENEIKMRARPIYDTLILDSGRGPVCAPEDNKKGLHSWVCTFCPFLGSEICPNPEVEWNALEEGKSPEKAFALASKTPYEPLEENVGRVTEKDLVNITKFLKRKEKQQQSDEETEEKAA